MVVTAIPLTSDASGTGRIRLEVRANRVRAHVHRTEVSLSVRCTLQANKGWGRSDVACEGSNVRFDEVDQALHAGRSVRSVGNGDRRRVGLIDGENVTHGLRDHHGAISIEILRIRNVLLIAEAR